MSGNCRCAKYLSAQQLDMYIHHCFILSTGFSLTMLGNTKMIFKIATCDRVSKSLSAVNPNFSIKFSNEIVFTIASSSLHIQYKTHIWSISDQNFRSFKLVAVVGQYHAFGKLHKTFHSLPHKQAITVS